MLCTASISKRKQMWARRLASLDGGLLPAALNMHEQSLRGVMLARHEWQTPLPELVSGGVVREKIGACEQEVEDDPVDWVGPYVSC